MSRTTEGSPVGLSQAASLTHRLFGIEPGYAPSIIYATNGCSGLDVFIAFGVGIAIAGVFFLKNGSHVPAGLAFAVFVLLTIAYEQFRSRERLGRARIRRNECNLCGTKKSNLTLKECSSCGHKFIVEPVRFKEKAKEER